MTEKLVDLHTHILFGIDDGARDLDESLTMARMWLAQGVTTVVATPHFDVIKQDINDFIATRDTNIGLLNDALFEHDIPLEVVTGAEIFYRSNLLDFDLRPLCIQNTDYLLIEFSTRNHPTKVLETFEELISWGYKPIIAHVERYEFLRKELDLFHELCDMGVVMQVNAETILTDKMDSFIHTAIQKGLVHIIASDAHRHDRRTPNLGNAYDKIGNIMNGSFYQAVMFNQSLDTLTNKRIRRFINKYY